MKQPHTVTELFLFQQYTENIDFLFIFSNDGPHVWGLSVIPLELQGKKHQPFSITQP